MALPTIMTGDRISFGPGIATATIAPLAVIVEMSAADGDQPESSTPHRRVSSRPASSSRSSPSAADRAVRLFQRAVTPEGLKLAIGAGSGGRRLAFLSSKRSMQTS